MSSPNSKTPSPAPLAARPGSAEFVGYSSDLGGWCAYSQPSRGDYKVELGPFSTAEDAQQAMKSDDSTTRLLSDAVSYASDQSLAFRKCAGHHAEHNPGAEAVALRAAEILDRIIADIRSPNAIALP